MTTGGRTLAVIALLALGAAGCGRGEWHRVSGRVHYADGSPVPAGQVVVAADNPKVGSWGLLKPDGTFTIGTYDTDDGMRAGTWRVSIEHAVQPPTEDNPNPIPAHLVHPRFRSPDTSGLQFTVPGQTFWDITVERPNGK